MIILNSVFLLITVSSMILQNSLQNYVSKSFVKKTGDTYYFNMFVGIVCFVLFGLLTVFGGGMSPFTAVVGLLYGACLLLCTVTRMSALTCGPMHLTLLLSTSSMIIPAMSGAVMFGESFSLPKLAAIVLLIGFVYISVSPGEQGNKSVSKKWFILTFISFWLQGVLGILQKLHQSSVYKSEAPGFLVAAFACSLIFAAVASRKNGHTEDLKKGFYITGIVCGITTFIMNYLNLILTGLLPSQLFFPLVNGSAFIFTSLVSVFVFKESITKKQLIGLLGGFASLILICFV